MDAVSGPLRIGRNPVADQTQTAPDLAVARQFARLRTAAAAGLGAASPARAVVDVATGPLIQWLGWSMPAAWWPVGHGMWTVLAEPRTTRVALLTLPWRRAPGNAARWAAERALGEGVRWAMISNGRVLRLLDARRPAPVNWAEIDLDLARDGSGPERLRSLASPHAFEDQGNGETAIDRAVRDADAAGVRLCRSLRHRVRHALDALGDALVVASAMPETAGRDEALIAVYRLLFLHFAEARGLVPSWHPIYRDGYTVAALVARLRAGASPRGLWASLQAMARLAHAGCATGALHVPAFNGRLFSPSRAPLLDRLHLDDREVARALEALSWTPDGPEGRRLIAYAELGVEELGSIYEHLLDDDADGRSARKSTGTFYTPHTLTDYLVRATLTPLVDGRRSEEILALRVLDPAMGSGAFLVAACRFLAEALERALVAEGRCPDHDVDEAYRARLRRQVARTCVFGVDANPMAVELAQLSLWLATLSAGRPLSFLDHHIRCGDSLVGASPADVLGRLPGRRKRPAGPLEAFFDACDALAPIVPARERIEQTPDDSVDVVRGKERTLAALYAHPALTRWRDACDLWCALWFPECTSSRAAYPALLDHVLGRPTSLPAAAVQKAAAPVLDTARRLRCFHWPLEFPEVFLDTEGRPRADGGFDAVVGNPPWEMLRRDAGRSRAAAGLMRFTRDSGLYSAQSTGHVNEYQLFVERALGLLKPGGRVGLLLPSGVLTDAGSASLRRRLITRHRLESVAVFSNRRAIFPIHRGLRFAAMTAVHSAATTDVRCRFGLEALEEVERLEPATGLGFPVLVTAGFLDRISGEDLAFPDLPTQDDVRLVERLSSRHPPLGSPTGWGVSFGRELNATEDRDCLSSTRRRGDLRVIEGRDVDPFRLRTEGLRWADAGEARRRLGRRASAVDRRRLIYREVASATNRLTLIAAMAPPGSVCLHTVFSLREPLPERSQLALCALLNSYVANYLVRGRVTTHVSAGVLVRLPMPSPGSLQDVVDDLATAAARLGGDAPLGQVEPVAQALAARAYGVTRDEFTHVLGTLPLVDPEARRAALAAFSERTRR